MRIIPESLVVYHLFYFFFLFICVSNLLFANDPPKVRQIKVRGNHLFTERQIVDLISNKRASIFSIETLQSDLQKIRSCYYDRGYLLTEVYSKHTFSDDSSTVDIEYEIIEGEEITLGEIIIEGNTVFPVDEILMQFNTKTERPLQQDILEQDIKNLLDNYSRSGYPLASVNVTDISIQRKEGRNTLKLVVNIKEGQKVYIQEYQVRGNKETKKDIILREVGIPKGEIYNQDKIDKIPFRLNRLGIFSKVYLPELYLIENGGGLILRVEEGMTNSFDGVLGYVPKSASGENGYLTGLLSVSMKNLFGTGRKLFLRWFKDGKYSQEIEGRYTEPWLFNFPLNLSCAFFQRRQDTTYVQWFIEGKTEVRLSDFIILGGLGGYESIIPSLTIAGNKVVRSRTTTAGLELQIDNRDDIRTPTSGVRYRSDYRVGIKRSFDNITASPSWLTVQKFGLDVEVYIPLIQRQILVFSAHGRQINVPNPQISDMFRFGGAFSLRGFRENQFIGSRVAWTNTEYRFLVERHSFVYGFFDAGYYLDQNSVEYLKYGYGAGVRLETGFGMVSVSFGLGKGDSFSQGKFHFGLMNEF